MSRRWSCGCSGKSGRRWNPPIRRFRSRLSQRIPLKMMNLWITVVAGFNELVLTSKVFLLHKKFGFNEYPGLRIIGLVPSDSLNPATTVLSGLLTDDGQTGVVSEIGNEHPVDDECTANGHYRCYGQHYFQVHPFGANRGGHCPKFKQLLINFST